MLHLVQKLLSSCGFVGVVFGILSWPSVVVPMCFPGNQRGVQQVIVLSYVSNLYAKLSYSLLYKMNK